MLTASRQYHLASTVSSISSLVTEVTFQFAITSSCQEWHFSNISGKKHLRSGRKVRPPPLVED